MTAVGAAAATAVSTDGPAETTELSQQGDVDPSDIGVEPIEDDVQETHTVELVTGHTVTVATHGDDAEILSVEDSDGDVATDVIQTDTEDGLFVVPDDPSVESFSEDLFNVELLIEQGLTVDEVDDIPVIVSYEEETGPGAMQAQAGAIDGFSADETFDIVEAQAGTIDPDADGVTDTLAGTETIEQVRLDAQVETQLNETADIINAPAAREAFDVDGENVTVAIIDSGIHSDHPDFGDRVIEQVDFSDDGVGDRRGHGTHVAGIAAGDGTESDGDFTGIAPGVEVMDLKALGDDGTGTFGDIINAIEYGVDQEADVLSMSLGGAATEDDDLTEAAEEAVDQGVHVVISAGNEGDRDSVTSPGQAEGAITVGAYNQADRDTIAFFSSGGPTADTLRIKPNVVAPGWLTTAPGSEEADEFPYTEKAGTSMSAPHVTGVLALMLQDNPDLSPSEAKSRLASTASHVPDEEADDVFMQGTGQVDAERALDPNLGIDDPFLNFGNYEEATNDTQTVELENLGNETLELEVSESLQNVPDNEDIDDQISTNESTITLDPGETTAVEVEINTEDAFGENSGIVTFETENGVEYRTAVGFVKAIDLEVTWERHPDGGGFDLGVMGVTSHDGTFSSSFNIMFGPGTESFRIPSGEINITADVAVSDGIPGEPGHLFPSSTAQIDQNNSEMTVRDEDAVRVDFDEEPLPDDGPFLQSDFHLTMHNTIPESSRTTRLSEYNVERTVWVSPTDPDSIAMPAIETVMLPEEDYLEDPEEFGDATIPGLAGETKYHLFLTLDDVNEPEDEISIDDPDDLATEEMSYNRFNPDRSYLMGPGLFMANDTLGSFSSAIVRQLSANETGPFDQTIYINEEARYSQRWNHLAGVSSSDDPPWSGERALDLIPEPGAEYGFDFNEHPLTGQVVSWQMDPLASFQVDPRVAAYGDGDAVLAGSWAPDEDLDRHIVIRNGEEVVNETTSQDVALCQTCWDDELEQGDTYEVIIEGNSLWATEERVVTGPTLAEDTYSSWEATYEPDTANAPPNIETFQSPTADGNNIVTDSPVPFHVEFETDDVDLDEVTAYYSTAEPETTPFEDADGWTEASVESIDELVYEFDVNVERGDTLAIAVSAVDEDGNNMETTNWNAINVAISANAYMYVDDEGVVTTDGLVSAISDFRADDISTETFLKVLDSYRSGTPIATFEFSDQTVDQEDGSVTVEDLDLPGEGGLHTDHLVVFEGDAVDADEIVGSIQLEELDGVEPGQAVIDLDSVEVPIDDVDLDDDGPFTVALHGDTQGQPDPAELRPGTVQTANLTIASDGVVLEFREVDGEVTNDPVTEGENLTVYAALENVGDEADTRTASLLADGEEVDDRQKTVDPGERKKLLFTYDTEVGDAPAIDVSLALDDQESTETTATVWQESEFTVNIENVTDPVTVEDDNITELEAEVFIQNLGDGDGTLEEDIVLEVNGDEEDRETKELQNGESKTISLDGDDAKVGDAEEVTVTVLVDTEDGDTSTRTVDVD